MKYLFPLCVLSSWSRQDEAEPIFQAGDGSVASRTCCSHRGPEFGSQHPQGSSEPSGTVISVPRASSGCQGIRHACGTRYTPRKKAPTQNRKQVILTKPNQSLRKWSLFSLHSLRVVCNTYKTVTVGFQVQFFMIISFTSIVFLLLNWHITKPHFDIYCLV